MLENGTGVEALSLQHLTLKQVAEHTGLSEDNILRWAAGGAGTSLASLRLGEMDETATFVWTPKNGIRIVLRLRIPVSEIDERAVWNIVVNGASIVARKLRSNQMCVRALITQERCTS
jgi:hypothetical protein